MQITTTKLKSGLQLISIPQPNATTVTVLVIAKTGSAYETRGTSGISHFLEHMMFKGTDKRPTTREIAVELDAIGGEYNAFTSKEWTGYYAKAEARHLPVLLDVLADMYLNSKFAADEIERERGVILEEMNMYQDTPTKYVEDLIEELLFGNQPQGWKVIGEPETVRAVNRQKMSRYHRQHYTAANSLVVIAGAWSGKNLPRLVNQYFQSIARGQKINKPRFQPVLNKKPAVLLHHKKTDQSHLILALPAYVATHRRLPALKILNIILGGNMSSRLFLNIREREALCYYIGSRADAYSDCGYWAVHAGVDTSRVERAISLILQELKRLAAGDITARDLQAGRDFYAGKLALSLETSNDVAFFAGGQQAVLGKIKTPAQLLAEVMSLRLRDLQQVAAELIKKNHLRLAIISPHKDKELFSRLLCL